MKRTVAFIADDGEKSVTVKCSLNLRRSGAYSKTLDANAHINTLADNILRKESYFVQAAANLKAATTAAAPLFAGLQ